MRAAPMKPPSTWDMWKGTFLVAPLLTQLSQGQAAGLEWRCTLQDLPPSHGSCFAVAHYTPQKRLKKSVAVLRGISLSLMIPSPCDQLQQTLLTHEAVLHAGHVSPLCKSAHRAEDTAASSCRSVLPAAILGWTWRACSWAPAAPRAGHREKRKRSDSYHSPQEAVTQTEACT